MLPAKPKMVRITTVPVSLLVLLGDQLQFMSDHFDITAVSASGPELQKLEQKHGIRTKAIEMTRKITPLKDLTALRKLYRLLKDEKPQIVHTHTPKAGLLGMIAAKLAGVPIRLHTVAGMPLLEATGVKRKLLELTERITSACATHVYPNSEVMKDIICEHKYCEPSKMKVIGHGSSNGVNTRHFDPALYTEAANQEKRREWGIAPDDLVYLFIGRIVKDKGITELVKAFKKISQHNQRVKLLLVGPFERDLDPLDADIEKEIETNPSIIWTGFQSDVRPFFAISDLFVFPSYREGFPNVVMQAGSMSIPSIVSDINGCNEIIEEGKNGVIVPVKDVKSLQRAMESLTNNAQLRHQMAETCRDLVVSRYDQQYVMNELLTEYEARIAELQPEAAVNLVTENA